MFVMLCYEVFLLLDTVEDNYSGIIYPFGHASSVVTYHVYFVTNSGRF